MKRVVLCWGIDSSPQCALWRGREKEFNCQHYLECGGLPPLSFSVRRDARFDLLVGIEPY
jgi:hypothetical protein